MRQDAHPRPAFAQAADDVRLEPKVEDRDERAAFGGVAFVARRLGRNLGHEILVFPAGDGPGARDGFVHVGLAGCGQDGAQGAIGPKVPGQASRVDAGDSRYARLAEHRGQLLGIAENRGRGIGHDQAPQPGSLGLVVVVDPAVVADKRVSHDHELAGIGGIGGDLLIAGLAGVHHEIALTRTLRAEGDAREDPAVLESEQRRPVISDPRVHDGAGTWERRLLHRAAFRSTKRPPASAGRWSGLQLLIRLLSGLWRPTGGRLGPVRRPRATETGGRYGPAAKVRRRLA